MLALLSLAGATAGCGGSAPAATQPARRAGPALDGCLRAGGDTAMVRFAAPGERLLGAVVGDGPIGVVLANESGNRSCDWLPMPSRLAAHGARTLLFDYGDGDDGAEVLAAARELRREGARRIVLVGASIGGQVVLRAAARAGRQHIDAVISLSGESSNRLGYDTPAAARHVRVPILYVGSRQDPWTLFAKDTHQLYRLTPARHKRLLLVPGDRHGVQLLPRPRVRRAIEAFIARHARA